MNKKKNFKKEIIKGEENEEKTKTEIINELEKEIDNIKNNSDTTKNSSTSSLSNYHDFYISDIENNKKESLIKEIKIENPKYKRMNYILKERKINKESCDSMQNEKNNSSKIYSPIYNYYEESEKILLAMKTNLEDFKNSINFVEKNIIRSTNFNFNNDKFIKKNNLNYIENKQNCNYNININNFVNLSLNNCNSYYNNYPGNFSVNNIINKMNYPKNLNINLFYNNIFYLNNENNERKNDKNNNDKDKNNEKEILKKENKNSNLNEKEDHIEENKNSKQNCNINNYNLQNNFSYEGKMEKSNEKKNKPKILENLNLIFNNTISQNYNSAIYNFNDNNNYNCNIINNNIISNKKNNNKYENYNNNKFNKIETGKKKTFCFRPNDWICLKCFNLNFSFRIYCNRCSAPKEILINFNNF